MPKPPVYARFESGLSKCIDDEPGVLLTPYQRQHCKAALEKASTLEDAARKIVLSSNGDAWFNWEVIISNQRAILKDAETASTLELILAKSVIIDTDHASSINGRRISQTELIKNLGHFQTVTEAEEKHQLRFEKQVAKETNKALQQYFKAISELIPRENGEYIGMIDAKHIKECLNRATDKDSLAELIVAPANLGIRGRRVWPAALLAAPTRTEQPIPTTMIEAVENLLLASRVHNLETRTNRMGYTQLKRNIPVFLDRVVEMVAKSNEEAAELYQESRDQLTRMN